MQETIKTYVIEEHHEAFLVWKHAIKNNWMPATGNCLYHVDEHSDMGTPRFNTSIHHLNGNLDVIKDFTYRELNIADFIVPAVYQDIFDRIYWIRQRHKAKKKRSHKMYVKSYNEAGKKLLSSTNHFSAVVEDSDDAFDEDIRTFGYYLRDADEIPGQQQAVVLDIDLDYFSCAGNPLELNEIVLEITEDEYNRFLHNPYHPVNFMFNRVEAEKEGDKYFYVFNYFNEVYPTKLKVEQQDILDRINQFTELLKQKRVKPHIIDICRSRFSGYTPDDQWEFIEKALLKNLKELYPIELIPVSELW